MKKQNFIPKNATVFTFCAFDPEKLSALYRKEWTEPRAGDAETCGFVPPTPECDCIVKRVGDLAFFSVKESKKILPASVVNDETDRLIASIEIREGRRVGRKERIDLKDDAILSLIPKAFVKHSWTNGWFDFHSGKLVIDTSSAAKAIHIAGLVDDSLFLLAGVNIKTKPWAPTREPELLMTKWIDGGEVPGFSLDDRITMKGSEGRSVKVIDPDAPGVALLLRGGRECVELAMTFSDKISFALNAAMQIKSIKFLDITAINESNAETAEEQWAAEMAFSGLAVRGLIADIEQAISNAQRPA